MPHTRSLYCYGIICKKSQKVVDHRYRKAEADAVAAKLGIGYFVKFAGFRIKQGVLVL